MRQPLPTGNKNDESMRPITFKEATKVVEMAERGGYKLDLEGRHALEAVIENGRGGIWLNLSEEQYAKLNRR